MKTLLTLFLITLNMCNHDSVKDPGLEGTTWTYNVSKSCINTLKLLAAGKVTEYDCELNYTLKGSYKVTKDTLQVTITDDSHSEDGGKATVYMERYLIASNTLRFIDQGELIKGKWKFPTTKPTSTVIYKKKVN